MTWPKGSLVRPKFEYVKRGSRLRCVVCGRTGYSHSPWIKRCQAGHPARCPHCGRRFVSDGALRHHEDHAQRGHDGCPPSPLFLGRRPVRAS